MKDRGFTLQNVNQEDLTFMFTKDDDAIVVECYPKGIYHLFWTRKGMLGFMDSGLLNDVMDDYKFNKNYNMFLMQKYPIDGATLYD